ncbi:MAG: molecular chaperone HtpG [Cellvibrionaceae bacterium]|jgi:molecular chaperone HtpG
MSEQKNYTFKAEIKQLLDILIHSLYKEKDIFLRELISNASDAITRLQFEMLTNSKILNPDAELAIHIEVKKPEEGEEGDSWLIIKDTGLGLTGQEMRENLGTIAQSGAREFIAKMEEGEATPDMNDVIGRFGVGFYSVFMAASEVRVISRSFKPSAKAAMWISDGGENYSVESAEKSDRGTEIHIKLREDAKEFADTWHLRQVIKKHSDFVAFPIYIGEDQINTTQSLWRKKPADIEEAEYNSFYQQMSMDFEPPTSTIHFSSDAPLNLRAVLFVPAKREKTMFAKRKEPGVMLYSKNVLIQEYCADLLPKWLQFVDGVVDSEDLPLNVSRESVQNTRIMRQLGKTVRKRVLRELGKLAKDDEKFPPFWSEFGRFFKEGIGIAPDDRDEIMPLLHFATSKSEGKLISFDTYIENMPEAQSDIYFVLGDDPNSVANSPHLDPFKSRDIEVIFLTDAFDAFMAPNLQEYKEKSFKNIDDGALEMPDIEAKEEESSDDDESKSLSDDELNDVVEKFKEVLGERVTDVRVSKVLRSSAVRLVSPEDGPNSAMSRLYRYVEQDYEVPKRILELNRKHVLINNLVSMLNGDKENPMLDLTVEQVYETALLQEGLHPNPADMVPRLQQMMELATKQ